MAELRERKFARTRLALARALSRSLTGQHYSDISVKSLCREAEVSEATFFNYFQRKQELVAYLAQLWLLELGWRVRPSGEVARGLAGVDELFAWTAKTCARKPQLFGELLVWMVRGGNLEHCNELGATEKQLAFPEYAGIEEIPVQGIDVLLVAQLEAAIATDQLPKNTLMPTLLTSLLTILLGVPLTLLPSDPDKIAGMYRQQLTLLWAGVRATAQGRQTR
jgi:AcrR family transcriptional regulator